MGRRYLMNSRNHMKRIFSTNKKTALTVILSLIILMSLLLVVYANVQGTIRNADQALLQGKDQGRDRIVCHQASQQNV